MSENQSQPNISGSSANPNGGPVVTPQPDAPGQPARPSDAEAAHAADGGAVRDPRQQTPDQRNKSADENRGSLDGHPSKDLSGDAVTGERMADRGGALDA
jgi:hypothetical protein